MASAEFETIHSDDKPEKYIIKKEVEDSTYEKNMLNEKLEKNVMKKAIEESASEKDILEKKIVDSTLENTSIEPAIEVIKSDTDTKNALSKNALKRLRRREYFEKIKPLKRQQEKEKKKKRRADAKEQGISLGPTRKSLKNNKMENSSRKETVVIDCDFDHLMKDHDIIKLVNQLQRCYSINRRSTDPLQLHVTSVDGKTLERLENVGDYKGWDVKFHADTYTKVFPKSQIVYLSSESDNILSEVSSEEVYIIGGLVDHNHQKGLCYQLALEKGLKHARLPIDQYIQLQSRKVLTIDQVFHILLQYLVLNKWDEAFYAVIPKRKGVAPIGGGMSGNSSEELSNEAKVNDENESEININVEHESEENVNVENECENVKLDENCAND